MFNLNFKRRFSLKIFFKFIMKFVFDGTGNFFYSDCDPCGLISEASSYLQKVKNDINHALTKKFQDGSPLPAMKLAMRILEKCWMI